MKTSSIPLIQISIAAAYGFVMPIFAQLSPGVEAIQITPPGGEADPIILVPGIEAIRIAPPGGEADPIILVPGVEAIRITPPGGEATPIAPLEETMPDKDTLDVTPNKTSDDERMDVVIYSLSRGAGVPEPAVQIMLEARRRADALEENILKIKEETIGLEGEKRLCVTFKSKESADVYHKDIARLANGVDLTDVRLESCSTDR